MTRIAVIEKEKCNPIGCGQYLCARLCPINRTGNDCIVKGEDNKAQINVELCTGCGICPKRCPYGAIHIINLPEELGSQPIHQYGLNGFHLYNLPIPSFGKVVGIVGKNGIGKSTAIKILAGVLEPNLGDFEKGTASYEELIQYFKGTEAQLYFEKVKNGEITVSYKPQQVELIPKTAKGKVKDLLEKVDEKGKLAEIAEALSLNAIMNNDIEKISGGELQRVAIAATVLKKANLYIFDEPTSYLDIKQRIKVAKFIRELADENTAVLVIEHDLIILDYMTDACHIMYGEENAYGIVSLPKATRTAINVYLSGYMREENIKFRNYEIKFDTRAIGKKIERDALTTWKNIKKTLGSFSLEATEGTVKKHEVSGILGENGIGKTTFVKILADVIKPDSGEISDDIRVSYKPQYLEADSEDLVMNVLHEAVKKYDSQLIGPLQIKALLLSKLCDLSGGQLQRVAIADCLQKDADLYLMDEPSAYLDAEQRLEVSKVIRDFMEVKGKTALIVDHDLLFIDYVSGNLIVFDGIPARSGIVKGPFEMGEGMNIFLEDLNLTFRRDPESNRPRANKPGSQMDQLQRRENKLYYI